MTPEAPASGARSPSPDGWPTDGHAHVLEVGRSLVAERHSAPAADATVDEYLGLLDAHGLAGGVLTAPSFYGDDNSLLIAALARAPDRLRGTATVSPEIGDKALRALAQQNVVGMRLNWTRRAELPEISRYRDLFGRVRRLDWHVEIYLEGPRLATVLPVILDSGVKVVVDHFGSPDPERNVLCPGFQAVLRGLSGGRTWVKLSAPYRLGAADPQVYAEKLLGAGGPERLVWGSDWPWVGHEGGRTYRDGLDGLSRWVQDSRTRRTILAETPAALFGFPTALREAAQTDQSENTPGR